MRRHGLGQARALGAAAIAVAAPLLLMSCKERNQYAAPAPAKVIVAHPVQQKITRYIEATGNTAAVNSVDLVARVPGFLTEIDYKDGAEVHKGDPLFTIEPQPYEAKLQQAQAAEAQQQAVVKQAEAEYQRVSTLGGNEFASRSSVDQALATRDSAKAALQQAQANTQQAAITAAYTRVRAPLDGVVTAHLASVGELVGGTEPTKLASIVQLDPIYVTFTINETDVLRIRSELARRGLTLRDIGNVPIEVGLQTEAGYPHSGVLDYAAPSVDQSTGTLPVRGLLQNPDRVLLPGYFVRVRVPVQRDVEATLVPELAVRAGQGGRYVLVVRPDNVVEQRPIQIGPLDGEMRVVEAGLKPDERVVVAGLQRAVPGQTVDPQLQAATAAVPAPAAARSDP
jgi:RND family efflux transporter MFP subunit